MCVFHEMLDTRNNASLLDLAVDLLRSARGALNSGQFGQARDRLGR